ncbi:MAG: hypothetical protein AAFP69_06125, partial [Planctomycetota bacterium]
MMNTKTRPSHLVHFLAASSAAAVVCVVTIGCGSGETPVADNAPVRNTPLNQPETQAAPPSDVVNAFMEAMRRGGDSMVAASGMLSDDAQKVLAELDGQLQPLGTPDAVASVGRYVVSPEAPNEALVDSAWQIPGEAKPTQIVWGVRKNASDEWRITGLTMETPDGNVTAVDFEDKNHMSGFVQSNAAAPSNAAQPGTPEQPGNFSMPTNGADAEVASRPDSP